MHSKVRCKDMHSKVVEAAGCKDCAKLGWSDREYVAVIKGGPRRIGLKLRGADLPQAHSEAVSRFRNDRSGTERRCLPGATMIEALPWRKSRPV